jgi:hypothetical protein
MHGAHRALIVVASALAAGWVDRVDAQSMCRPADQMSAILIQWLGFYTSATTGQNLAARAFLKLPLVPADQLSLVTQDATCRKANTTYEAAANASGGTGLSGRLWVVEAGTSFAVVDPDYHWGPAPGWWTVVTMDSTFKKLSETATPWLTR